MKRHRMSTPQIHLDRAYKGNLDPIQAGDRAAGPQNRTIKGCIVGRNEINPDQPFFNLSPLSP